MENFQLHSARVVNRISFDTDVTSHLHCSEVGIFHLHTNDARQSNAIIRCMGDIFTIVNISYVYNTQTHICYCMFDLFRETF